MISSGWVRCCTTRIKPSVPACSSILVGLNALCCRRTASAHGLTDQASNLMFQSELCQRKYKSLDRLTRHIVYCHASSPANGVN